MVSLADFVGGISCLETAQWGKEDHEYHHGRQAQLEDWAKTSACQVDEDTFWRNEDGSLNSKSKDERSEAVKRLTSAHFKKSSI